jgi:hypothetical protein
MKGILSRNTAFNRLVARLLYGRPDLRHYEKQCVDWLIPRMDPESTRILLSQIHGSLVIERSSNGKLVSFAGLQDQTDVEPFPARTGEVHFATVRFRSPQLSHAKCDFTAYDGKLSTMEFNRSPQVLTPGSIEFIDCAIHEDLLDEGLSDRNPAVQTMTGRLIEKFRQALRIEDVKPAVTDDQLAAFEARIEAAVPPDFTELVRETNGFSFGDWRFLGTAGRRIVLPEANYVYVAESSDHAIALREGNDNVQLFLHDEIGDEFTDLGSSIVDAIIDVSRRDFGSE